MALFILFYLFLHCFSSLLGLEESSNKLLEIKSTTITADQNVVFYKVDETLNLTCIFKNESTLPDVVLEWVMPSKASNSQNRVIYRQGTNIVLVIENLQENDSGEYKCKATHNGTPFFSSESSVRIKVKNKKKECKDVMFQCSGGICIHKRYTCDGLRDCPHGEDESPNYCGPGNPCDNKLMCSDYRCIPYTWCCESHKEPNCTTKIKHSCCTQVEKLTREVDNEFGFQFEQQRFSDMGFLQTTVYTVIGCAMAFMFIVTIIVIAICRVHVRRTLLSRCPARNLPLGRGGTVHGNNLAGWSIYDLDLCFNTSGLRGNDLMSVNPLLVTYNINNGVQFVGRPVDPPPYCEVVTSPPKEGPPPPYVSRENLSFPNEDKREEVVSEPTSMPEPTESDALLDDSAQSISVISSNAIDVVSEPHVSCSLNSAGCKYSESVSKECSNADQTSNSSHHRFADVSKFKESKSCGGNIIVIDGGSSDQVGEPSSIVSGSACDLSINPVKNLHCSKSLDNNFRRKSNNFTVNSNSGV